MSYPDDPGVSAPTGDPDALIKAASWHENLSGFFETTARTIQYTAGSLQGANWSGEAASSYQDLSGLVIGHFRQAATTATTAADALRRYGTKLDQLQKQGVAAVDEVAHWMKLSQTDRTTLTQAQAELKSAQDEVNQALKPTQVSTAATRLQNAQTAERAAQRAVDHDDQQVLRWQRQARLIWHEAQNEAALATGSLEPLEIPPPPLAGAPATFSNALADDAPFLAANPQLTQPLAHAIAAANAKKNKLSGDDESKDEQAIIAALNSGKSLDDVKLSVPEQPGGGWLTGILAGAAVVGTEIVGGGPEDPLADGASVAEVAAIEGTADTVEAATAGAEVTEGEVAADVAALGEDGAEATAGDVATDEDPLGYGSSQTGDGKNAIDHIMDNHGPGSPKPWKGKFADGTTTDDVKQIVDETLEGDPEGAPNAPDADGNPREGRVYKTDLGRTVGTTGKAGNPTSWVKVVVNGAGKIITAYPIKPPA